MGRIRPGIPRREKTGETVSAASLLRMVKVVTARLEAEQLADWVDRELGPGPLRFTAAVTDSGIGIPADSMDRLFESFSQVDSSTTRLYGRHQAGSGDRSPARPRWAGISSLPATLVWGRPSRSPRSSAVSRAWHCALVPCRADERWLSTPTRPAAGCCGFSSKPGAWRCSETRPAQLRQFDVALIGTRAMNLDSTDLALPPRPAIRRASQVLRG